MNLPGTSAHASPHHHISRVSPSSPFTNFTTFKLFTSGRFHFHHWTPSRSPLCYTRSSPHPFTLHDCTPHISPLSTFPNFTTSNLPTLYTVLAYLHFKLPNKDLPFAFRSYPLSLNVLFSFSLIFAPSPSLWALLPTTHTYLVSLLYVYRHLFIRITSPICTYIISCLYVPSRVEVRIFSINPLKYSYKLFKGFVQPVLMIYINCLKDLSKRYVQVGEDVRIRGRASTYKRRRRCI